MKFPILKWVFHMERGEGNFGPMCYVIIKNRKKIEKKLFDNRSKMFPNGRILVIV